MEKKRVLSMILSAVLLANAGLSVNGMESNTDVPLPEAQYYWDFEHVEEEDAGDGALLKAGASIAADEERESNVLRLPGGGNGEGGYLELPELFENVGDEGFTLSMWVKPDAEANPFQRVFEASNSELGATDDGGYGWQTPEFGLVAGGGDYDTSIYVGEAGEKASYMTRFSHGKALERGIWQYITVSVSPSAYQFYVNGAEQPCSFSGNEEKNREVKTVLTELFRDQFICQYRHVSIGRSIYGSDGDFKGLVDNISFYNRALTAQEVNSLAVKEGLSQTTPDSYYWDFEHVTGKDAGDGAYLKANASIVEDPQRGNVLELPGGANGQGGYLDLPNLFDGVSSEGFTLAMWIKPSSGAGAYQRFFEASNSPLGATYDGGCGWQLPELGLTAGGGDYDASIYVGEPEKQAKLSTRFSHEKALERNQWQYFAVSVTPEAYSVYINGIEQTCSYTGTSDEEGIKAVLAGLFEGNQIGGYRYVSIGRGLYSSDGDFNGWIDSVAFYKEAMTKEEIDDMARREGVPADTEKLEQLLMENQGKEEQRYTVSTWTAFQEAMRKATWLVGTSEEITLNQIFEAGKELEAAVEGLAERGDKSELQKIFDVEKARIESDYTAASWKVFANALKEAEAVLGSPDGAVSEASVEKALKQLEMAAEKLMHKTDKTGLQSVYDESRGKNPKNYTEATWAAFMEAFGTAKGVLFDMYAGQEQIDSAAAKLQEASAALILIDKETDHSKVKADKTKLRAVYDANSKKNRSEYTETGWGMFSAAMQKAETVLQNPNASQAETDSALESLERAVRALIPVRIVSRKSVTIGMKEKYSAPVSGAAKDCRFTTSDSKIAKISANGQVTGVGKGKAVITSVNKDGKAVALNVTVKKAPSKIKRLNAAKKTLRKGRKFKIKTILPPNSASNKITYRSNKKSVAAVNAKGVVTARSKGRAVITVKTFNNKRKKIIITVK